MRLVTTSSYTAGSKDPACFKANVRRIIRMEAQFNCKKIDISSDEANGMLALKWRAKYLWFVTNIFDIINTNYNILQKINTQKSMINSLVINIYL